MKTYKIKIDGKEHEVLGCPFCGAKPLADFFYQSFCKIYCGKEKCQFLVETYSFTDLKKVIKRWNKRASQ